MRSFTILLTVAFGMVLLAFQPTLAQDRARLILEARNEPDRARALDLLMQAADPEVAPLDSLWAAGVHRIALRLLTTVGDEDLAPVWLRWSARQGPRWPIDRALPTVVVEAYDRAVSAVQPGAGSAEETVATRWDWPDEFDADAQGQVAVTASGTAAPVSVNVEGVGEVSGGGTLTLEPGTYRMVAVAQGYETAEVTREVLPGVTTVLDFALAPLLPEASEARIHPVLVSIRSGAGDPNLCVTGFMARSGGLVLTSRSALPGTTGLEVTTSTGVYRNVSVAEADEDLDLAVLRLDLTGQPTLTPASGASAGQYAWSVFRPACEGPVSSRTRLAAWPSPASGPVPLASSIPQEARGAPLVDRAGELVAVVVGTDEVAPMSLAEALLARALDDLVGTQVAGVDSGGGPPWIWIGAGAVAVGVAAAVLGGGGGGDTPPPTTGSITVTFPGGAP